MITQVSNNIQVRIITEYQAEYSNMHQQHYIFTHKVYLKNMNLGSIQILNEQWEIYNSDLTKCALNGNHINRKQPVLDSGECYHYISGCVLKTDISKIRGCYQMLQLNNHYEFEIIVPDFTVMHPSRLN